MEPKDDVVIILEGENEDLPLEEDNEQPETPEAGNKEGENANEDEERQKLILESKNLEKATLDELRQIRKIKQDNLRNARQERKSVRQELVSKIDNEDETAQVWSAKIEDEVSPIREELDEQKAEIFDELFIDFASEYPMTKALAERVINTYQKLATNSGLNPKAVQKDIMRAYAAETAEEQAVIGRKASNAEDLATRASVAVTKANGSSTGLQPKKLVVNKEVYSLLKQSGMTDEQIREHYKNKNKDN